MADPKERLTSSLLELKKYQEQNNTGVVKGSFGLGRTHLQRLVENGWSEPVNARANLASVETSAQIIRIASINGNSSRVGRVVGALRNIGRDNVADEVLKFMQRLGYDIRIEDPFDDIVKVSVYQSPYVSRIRLLWEKMRDQILSMNFNLLRRDLKDKDSVLKSMEANYVKDAYHSLSIEGYRVTESLIERVRSGAWNPDTDDSDRRNALAARGYYQAFMRLQKSMATCFGGETIIR